MYENKLLTNSCCFINKLTINSPNTADTPEIDTHTPNSADTPKIVTNSPNTAGTPEIAATPTTVREKQLERR